MASGSDLQNLSLTWAFARKAMDASGYNFVLGSARAWFERDDEDGRVWPLQRGLLQD
jgi:hypothetical protein